MQQRRNCCKGWEKDPIQGTKSWVSPMRERTQPPLTRQNRSCSKTQRRSQSASRMKH